MTMVALIQKVGENVRDAVILIDEWYLPVGAVFTNKFDEAGRAIYTMFKEAETEVVSGNLKTQVETTLESVANTLVQDFKSTFSNSGTEDSNTDDSANT